MKRKMANADSNRSRSTSAAEPRVYFLWNPPKPAIIRHRFDAAAKRFLKTRQNPPNPATATEARVYFLWNPPKPAIIRHRFDAAAKRFLKTRQNPP